MLSLNDSSDNLTTFISQNISKSARYLTDDSMGAKHTESVSDTSGQTPFCMGIMISGIDSLPNIPVSKSVYIEFASADYFQKGCIFFSPWAQGTNPLAFPMNWAANRLNDLTQQTIHFDRGEGIQIPLIRSLRNLGSPMQIGNAFTHWLPGTGAFGIRFVLDDKP